MKTDTAMSAEELQAGYLATDFSQFMNGFLKQAAALAAIKGNHNAQG